MFRHFTHVCSSSGYEITIKLENSGHFGHHLEFTHIRVFETSKLSFIYILPDTLKHILDTLFEFLTYLDVKVWENGGHFGPI